MPLSIYNSGWRTAKNVYVRANNAWQNVKQVYVYANGTWRSVFTSTKPAVRINIWDPSSNITIAPNTTITIRGRLEDEDGNTVSEVRSITWTESGPGTFNSFPTQTGADGNTSVVYSVGNNTGTNDITLSSPSLIGDSLRITIALQPALIPSLSTSRFNEGYYLFHFNPNTSWSYSVSLNPSTGNSFIGNIYNFQSIVRIPPRNDVAPDASTTSSLSYVECTRGSWTFQPFVQTTVSSFRDGYDPGSSTVGDQPTGNTSFLYQWQYSTNGGSSWINWDSPQVETLGNFVRKNKGTFYNNTIKGNKLRCEVTGTRSGGSGGGNPISTIAYSDTITAE
jgi:hypothetical protein